MGVTGVITPLRGVTYLSLLVGAHRECFRILLLIYTSGFCLIVEAWNAWTLHYDERKVDCDMAHSTCWVLKVEVSFQVCWNCWSVVNWSWSKYNMTSRHTSLNVFLHNMILRTQKKNSDVWHWFRCRYVCHRTLFWRHHGTVECFRNSVTFHSIGILMPETSINST